MHKESKSKRLGFGAHVARVMESESIYRIYCILWHVKVNFIVHNNPSLVSILTQKNPVNIPTPRFFKIHFKITIPSNPRSLKKSLSFQVKVCTYFSHAPCMLNCNLDDDDDNNNNNMLRTSQTTLYCNTVFTVLTLITLRIRCSKLRNFKQQELQKGKCSPENDTFTNVPYAQNNQMNYSALLATCFTIVFFFLAWLILRPWRLRRHFSPKRRLTFNGLHDVISQKIELFEGLTRVTILLT
jgi:hypothetical protein